MSKEIILSLVAIVIAIGGWFAPVINLDEIQTMLSGEGDTNFTNVVAEDVTATDDLAVTDDATITDDLTVSGGSFTLTTSNTATSSATIGCIQMYATSTATAWRLALSSIASTTALHGGGNADVAVMAQYGTCPR